MRDLGHDMTENQLAALERRIRQVYKAASEDLQKKADEYFETVTERIGEKMEQREADIDKDIAAGKKVMSELIEAADKALDAATDEVIEKLHLNE